MKEVTSDSGGGGGVQQKIETSLTLELPGKDTAVVNRLRSLLGEEEGVVSIRDDTRTGDENIYLVVTYFPSDVGIRTLLNKVTDGGVEYKVVSDQARKGLSPSDVEKKVVLRLFIISIVFTVPMMAIMIMMLFQPSMPHRSLYPLLLLFVS